MTVYWNLLILWGVWCVGALGHPRIPPPRTLDLVLCLITYWLWQCCTWSDLPKPDSWEQSPSVIWGCYCLLYSLSMWSTDLLEKSARETEMQSPTCRAAPRCLDSSHKRWTFSRHLRVEAVSEPREHLGLHLWWRWSCACLHFLGPLWDPSLICNVTLSKNAPHL